MVKLLRGYYIRTERAGYQTELKHAWAENDTLPQEWEAVKSDATVKEAQIFKSSQRNRQHQKRRILDSYSA